MAQDFVDRIYEAAALPELWPGLLHDVAVENGFAGGAMVSSNPDFERCIVSEGLEPLLARYIDEDWSTRYLRCLRIEASSYNGFMRDQDVVTDDELENAPVYAELLRPLGLGYGAGACVVCPSDDKITFAFERLHRLGETPRAAVEALDALRPHFARASVFAARLNQARSRAQVSALDGVGLPAAVIGRERQVLAANPGFQALTAQVRIGARDRLSLVEGAAESLLADALSSPASRDGRSIPLRAAVAAPPGVLHVLPVRRDARDIFAAANWLLVATPLGAAAAPVDSILRALFDLSPAEARVAREVVGGETVTRIAAKFGLSEATVRTQLRAVFSKTGTSRQSELVAACMGVAAVPNIAHVGGMAGLREMNGHAGP